MYECPQSHRADWRSHANPEHAVKLQMCVVFVVVFLVTVSSLLPCRHHVGHKHTTQRVSAGLWADVGLSGSVASGSCRVSTHSAYLWGLVLSCCAESSATVMWAKAALRLHLDEAVGGNQLATLLSVCVMDLSKSASQLKKFTELTFLLPSVVGNQIVSQFTELDWY